MAYVKVDDGFYDHPRVVDVPLASLGLWIKALSYCRKHLTDGHVTCTQIAHLSRERATKRAVAGLLSAGLWERTENGYVFRDYHQHNDSKAKVLEARRADRERKAKKQGRQFRSASGRNPLGFQAESARLPGDKPNPTQPNPTQPTAAEAAATRAQVRARRAAAQQASGSNHPVEPTSELPDEEAICPGLCGNSATAKAGQDPEGWQDGLCPACQAAERELAEADTAPPTARSREAPMAGTAPDSPVARQLVEHISTFPRFAGIDAGEIANTNAHLVDTGGRPLAWLFAAIEQCDRDAGSAKAAGRPWDRQQLARNLGRYLYNAKRPRPGDTHEDDGPIDYGGPPPPQNIVKADNRELTEEEKAARRRGIAAVCAAIGRGGQVKREDQSAPS